ncbi:NAD(P)-binding protein [Gymnopus androsaceus JB14]|uniref:NAD(P)-binding protein n=1 Tax=Gymnopus androsaceus JB14 TaxID=1447944 RepID=A0A6A4HFM8_9AGAR|nr:NAD(P)-binding protein [Gymnopus androsaceus JB14]
MSLKTDLPVTARHDVYEAISPDPYFYGSSSDSSRFRGKIILVVGASKGIGYTIASFYARSRSDALAADSADTKAIEQVVDKVVTKYGRLDIVVASSGVSSPWTKRFSEQDPDNDWWKALEVNLRGTYNVAHFALPHLAKTRGYFIAISSRASQVNRPFASAYAVSKVAINRFIEYAAIEHPQVKCFSFHPGTIKTEGSLGLKSGLDSIMVDTLQLPAATILKLTDGSGRFDWLSGRFVSANWDLDEVERDWKKDIVKKDLLKTRFVVE